MVKKKQTLKNVPRKYLVIGLASIGINVLVFATLIIGQIAEKSGQLDYAIVNMGIEHMCSDQFRQKVERDSKARGESDNDRGLALATIDFPCKQNGAAEFYDKGIDQYIQTLGLTRTDK